MALEKYKDHPSIKMINENVSFESHLTDISFKDISETDIKKNISILNSKKAGAFGNIPKGHLEIFPQKFSRNLLKSAI